MNAEKKLAEYRTRKRKQAYFDKANETFKSLFRMVPSSTQSEIIKMEKHDEASQNLLIDLAEIEEVCSNADSEDLNCNISFTTILTYILYFILWITLLIIFIQLQFGLVYCLITAFIAMYVNTRTGPKRKNEISAYSIFNKNCESINGTLKAEQFEREIRFGPTSIR